jgi:hypothetical protein
MTSQSPPDASAEAARAGLPPGALMRQVADELAARGCIVQLPRWDDERRLSVEYQAVRCDLAVNDSGDVDLEFRPSAGGEARPELMADIAALLLSGNDESGPRETVKDQESGLSFWGIVGNDLRSRGFNVRLDVYVDDDWFEIFADLQVSDPAISPSAHVRVSDDGTITWECDYQSQVAEIESAPDYFAAIARQNELAESIAAQVARALALSPGEEGLSEPSAC